MNDNLKDLFARLSAPFHPDDIEWRAGATNADKTKALALAYITSRAVMDRLDEVIGPENWHDEYAPGPDGGVICGLSLRIQDEWITKWDGAENTDFEAVKAGSRMPSSALDTSGASGAICTSWKAPGCPAKLTARRSCSSPPRPCLPGLCRM